MHNITDVNDKIYDGRARPRAPSAPREATRWYLEDTAGFGLGHAGSPAEGDRLDPRDRPLHRGAASRPGTRTRSRATSTSASPRRPTYGQLSGQRPDRVEEQEPNALKEDPRDFALWKANKPGEDTSWDSPWGRGRPGWHIECSAMAEELLGPAFEIHGGGLDLVFPHHENELAQSRALGPRLRAASGCTTGCCEMTGEKMSKSVGNIISIRDALDTWGRETLLLYFMTAHWRKPMDFNDDVLHAGEVVRRDAAQRLPRRRREPGCPTGEWERARRPRSRTTSTRRRCSRCSARLARQRPDAAGAARSSGSESLAELTPRRRPRSSRLAEQRARGSRAAADFAESDRLRAEIEAAGWDVRDVAEPPGFQLVPRQ